MHMEPHTLNGASTHAPTSLATKYLLESLLFVAAEPTSIADLARALNVAADAVEALLGELSDEYRGRGLRIQRHAESVQLVSAPEAASVIERFLGVQHTAPRLSNAALETLAIIAYKQPLTRAGLEAVRGVDCSGAVRTLLQRGLIAEVGRLQTAGRPVLYGTSEEFLKQFGIESLVHLPPIQELDA
jgi:segregation and condensation protein B